MKKAAITIEELMKADIRIGLVTSARPVEGSNKLIELTVELGSDYGTVTVFTGLQKYYTPDDFVGKKFPFVANLEPKPMMGKVSQGMILAADHKDKPVLIPVHDSLSPGDAVI